MRIYKILVIMSLGGVSYWLLHRTELQSKENVMKIMSPAFNHGDHLPRKYTCDGDNVNPPLRWEGAPQGTQSFAIIVDDPNAPATKPDSWVHWIVFNIPATTMSIDENLMPGSLQGAQYGTTTNGERRYQGACPPRGNGVHHYRFTVYALNTLLDVPEGVVKHDLEVAFHTHLLAQAHLVATYERN